METPKMQSLLSFNEIDTLNYTLFFQVNVMEYSLNHIEKRIEEIDQECKRIEETFLRVYPDVNDNQQEFYREEYCIRHKKLEEFKWFSSLLNLQVKRVRAALNTSGLN
ncbi:hypothetical protein [Perlabentimonas gracilis]|uniref:hypothetical protein n=1 Tax=Perlabentimonas gracilis TaxID=2715279 RepID=UPI00140C08B4|nr:hypothetical protein [Perlabentimonas gracilis]NHB67955.1 hypothetical protein [Perlabentimonas gracilis]